MIQDMFEPLLFVNKINVSDGMGGTITKWQDGAEFQGVITLDNSTTGRLAEQQGVTNIYTIITEDKILLEFNDVIKRKSDQQTFKIKSLNNKENRQPEIATMQLRIATAEIFDLLPILE